MAILKDMTEQDTFLKQTLKNIRVCELKLK